MKEASFYSIDSEGIIRCELCPHYCRITNGKFGICGVRYAKDGRLYAKTYGLLSSVSIDPVEKKPLYHFFPSQKILSIGSYGCNLNCKHCQNASISQCRSDSLPTGEISQLEPMMNEIKRHNLKLLAFTYNEPVVFYEYMHDIAIKAINNGIKTAMVSNGFINKAPLTELLPYMSAFNIDLKAFSQSFYQKYTGATLQPVLDAIRTIHDYGKHLELTFLVIPGLNDEVLLFRKMVDFIADELGKEVVLHITRYFPHYKTEIPPTPINTIKLFTDIACERLDYVYAGNTGNSMRSSTYCPACGKEIIRRLNYTSEPVGIQDNICKFCSFEIAGIFKNN